MTDEALTPLADHVSYAIERMEAGARMILDAIPNDSSLSSASFPPDVTQEIARQLRALARKGISKPLGAVEITDDMMQAGMKALHGYHKNYGDDLRAAFKAMCAISKPLMAGDVDREAVLNLIENCRPLNPKSDWTLYASHKNEICMELLEKVRALSASPAVPVNVVERAAKVIWAKADFQSNGTTSQNTWENVSQPVRDWALDVARAALAAISEPDGRG